MNLGHERINLAGWTLADSRTDHHIIADELWLEPGAYAVLGRNGDTAINGGVALDYQYAGIRLANNADDLLVLAPWGDVIDRVEWGGETGFRVRAGISLERIDWTSATGWVYAVEPWPGSAGDWGSPGAPYIAPVPTAVPTATSPPISPPTAAPSPSPSATATVAPTVTPAVTPTPFPQHAPPIFITELMIDPHAVADHLGEWFELYNGGTEAINLAGWRLTDLGRDDHTIEGDLWLAPGAYAVLARRGDPQENGGIVADYVYRGIQLANRSDALLLHTPWGVETDRVMWGITETGVDTGLRVRPGVSLERVPPYTPGDYSTGADGLHTWVEAVEAWPGSAGDWGTPGQAFRPRAATPTPTLAPTAAPTTLPTTLPTDTPPPALGSTWTPVDAPSALVIDQVYYRTPDLEFVTLVNRGNTAQALTGYIIGDVERPGKQEGLYALPAHVQLEPGQPYVIARRAEHFTARWGQRPHAEFEETDPLVPTLTRRGDLARGTWALNAAGDEVVLLTPELQLADVLVFGNGDYTTLGLQGELRTSAEESLQRVPGAWFPSITDQRHRFLRAPPEPFASRALPSSQARPTVQLAANHQAAWGSLGIASTFSPDGLAPPHYLIAAAAADGLDFLALADNEPATARLAVAQLIAPESIQSLAVIPAWQWHAPEGSRAIVYSPAQFAAANWGELWHGVATHGGLVQVQGVSLAHAQAAPQHASTASPSTLLHTLAAIQADQIDAPGGTDYLYQSWAAFGEPLLPGGNGIPQMSGLSTGRARYTGLALPSTSSTAVDTNSVLAALAQRRGWLTSRPGIWLTLRSDSGVWMGSRLTANEVNQAITLEIDYGDRFGAPAGLALWQDDQLLHQLDTPPYDDQWPDGKWTVQVSPQPGTFLYAVATLLSGDFAVTAPILIEGHSLPSESTPPASAAPSQPTPSQPTFLQPTPSQPSSSQPTTSQPGQSSSHSSSGNHATDAPKHDTRGQATGPMGSLAMEKLRGLNEWVEFRAQVTVPPGYFNSAIYVAEPARLDDGTELAIAGLGIQVYLHRGGVFAPLAEGDWVLVRGKLGTHRGEMEVRVDHPDQVQRIGPGLPLQPLITTPAAVGESLEGRLITVRGSVVRWQGDSIYLADADDPAAEPVRVTVRSSLDWKRPFVQRGEIYQATGVLSQFAQRAPWNGGYRILVRYPEDLFRID